MDGVAGKPETRIKYALLVWHRRAGKDKSCFNYMLKEAAVNPGNYFYAFPEATEARKALWENVDQSGFKLLDHIPGEIVASINNQEMLIRYKNGSTIRVLGLDKNPDGIRGTAIRGMVMSEVAFSKEAETAFKASVPAVEEADGWVILNSTPNGRGFFYEMANLAQSSPKWYYSRMQTYWPEREDYTGLVPPEEIQSLIKDKGYAEEDVEREYGVCFSTGMRGAYYSHLVEKARDDGRVGFFPHDDHRLVDTFWDIGVDDSTAIWFRQVVGHRIVFIDYLEANGEDTYYFAQQLARKGYEYGTHYLPHDGATRSWQTKLTNKEMLADHCRDLGISDHVETNQRLPKLDGINAVRARFSRYHFNEATTAKAVDMISMYHKKYDKARQAFSNEPVHDFTSHCADALRTEAMAEDDHVNEFGEYTLDFKVLSMDDYDVLSGGSRNGPRRY